MISSSAPGKIILFGEHAVVYGRPAIAVPVHEVRAKATISELKDEDDGIILVEAPNINLSEKMADLNDDHPLRKCIQLTLNALKIEEHSPFKLRITSTIPIASGMGSSAAISVSTIRALSQHFDKNIEIEIQSKIAFEIERIHHGTPSGIDNTVVTYGQPVYFRRGEDPQVIIPGEPLHFLVANTGIQSQTAQVVGEVRERWIQNENYYEAIFDQISDLSNLAKRAITSGPISVVGPLINQNQLLLEALGVSSPEIELMVKHAQEAGAFGAKLSGAGQGGNIIVLIEPDQEKIITEALHRAGAKKIISTRINP
jgi:mevalonate kinase